MKTFTIAAIALMANVGLVSAQQPPEPPAREHTLLQRQLERLEARHRQLVEALARRPGDDRFEAEIREVETALRRLRIELQEMQAEPGAERHRLEAELESRQRHLSELSRQHVREIEERSADMQRIHEEQVRQSMRAMEEAEALAARLRHETAGEPARRARTEEALAAQAEVLARQRHEMQQSQAAIQEQRERQRHELTEALARIQDVEEHVERAGSLDFERELDRLYRDGPRAAWAAQDPADSLWRAARDRMNRGSFEEASRLFERIHSEQRYRQSAYRADALYWHAFALNRIGTRESIRQSLELLQRLTREYPAEDRHADTNGLLTTVQVRLAEMGSEDALQQVRAVAVPDEARLAYARTLGEVDAMRAARLSQEAAIVNAQARTIDNIERSISLQSLAGTLDGVALTSPLGADAATYLNWGLPVSRLTSLGPQCARDESEIQLIALNSLVRMDTAAAMPVLREVIARRDDCAAPLRQSALVIIGRIRTPEAQRILLEAARNDPDTGVRRAALLHLSTRDEPQAVAIARDALQSARTADDRQWALQALARMRTGSAWAVIRDYAARTDVDTDARRAAIAALSGSNDSTNTAFLRSLYGRVGADRSLKEAILMSSAFRRAGSDPEWLLAIAQDAAEDQRIREYAVTALSRNRDIGTPRFTGLYDSVDDKRVKLAIVRILADRARSDAQAVEKLIAIARTESDPDLRKSAVLGLPANDPRARELLLEILRGM